jgi:lysophospholipase L1-like esterase/pimeloyl-ACP methyl ester carboxylesterase
MAVAGIACIIVTLLCTVQAGAQTSEEPAQFPDGRIVFTAPKSTGASTNHEWSWDYKPTRWGMYDVDLAWTSEDTKKAEDAAAPEVQIEVAGKKFETKLSGEKGTQLGAARVYIAKAEPFTARVRCANSPADFNLTSLTLRPAPEGEPIVQRGPQILLPASGAITHSVTMRYEPATNKNCLGYWVNPADSAEWQFTVSEPGTYSIELWQGCGKGQGGSDVDLEVSSGGQVVQKTSFVVEETGHFQIVVPRNLGTVQFAKPGDYSLWLRPRHKKAGAIMDVRQIVLKSALEHASAPLKRVARSRRVLFLGDSITYSGEYVEFVEAYVRMAAPHSTCEFINLGLPSETVSGLSEPGHAGGAFPRPDLHERLARALDKTRPDLIFACYGMNDGIYYPFSNERFEKFQQGMRDLHEAAQKAGAPIIHLTPSTFDPLPLKGHTLPDGRAEYPSPYEGYNKVLDRYSDWLMQQRSAGWEVIDLHTPMNQFIEQQRQTNPQFSLARDGVHVNAQGHWLMAREILLYFGAPNEVVSKDSPEGLLQMNPRGPEILKLVQKRQRMQKDSWLTSVGHLRPGMNKGKPLPEAEEEGKKIGEKLQSILALELPGKRSLWFGFERFDFEVDGKPVLVVCPKVEAPGRPWEWQGEFFGHKPNPDLALLGRGFHVVYMSVPDMLGGPEAVRHWNALYDELTTRFGFSPRPALTGLSRGGLYCYNWAEANPEKVGCIYGDAPVCDFKSWPGGFGKGQRSDRDWQLVLEQYHFKSDDEAKAYKLNPIDNLAGLAQAKVPLLHVFGDADEVVPWQENTKVIADRYKALGGDITLIRKPGVHHHPHGLDNSTPIVDFIWKNATTPEAKAWLESHGGGPLDEQMRPLIRRLGTVDLDLVETTPIILSNRVWRFEWVRNGFGQQYWNNQRHTNYFRFRDPETGEATPPFGDGHEFGSAFVDGGRVYVTGSFGRGRVDMFASTDLTNWESWPVIPEGRYGIFNTSLCRAKDDYVLMFEIDHPAEEAGAPFTARFARSKDLHSWEITPPECNYSKNRYTAPHALRWKDGWFYDFFLEAHDGYEMRVVRSRDLVHWELSPRNPVLRHSPLDKIIANPALTDAQRTRIAHAANLNNSDIDFREWQGRLVIDYSWGNQQGTEQLAQAVYDGTLDQFLDGWW